MSRLRLSEFSLSTLIFLIILLNITRFATSRRLVHQLRGLRHRQSTTSLVMMDSTPLNNNRQILTTMEGVRTSVSNPLPSFLSRRGSSAVFVPIEDISPTLGRRVKSLVWEYDGCPVLVVVDISRSVDVDELARCCHVTASSLALAPRERATQLTGYELGNVPPLGLLHPMRTIIDEELLPATDRAADSAVYREGSDVLYADSLCLIYGGGGESGVELLMPLDELLAISGAEVHRISTEGTSSSAQNSIKIATEDSPAISNVGDAEANLEAEAEEAVVQKVETLAISESRFADIDVPVSHSAREKGNTGDDSSEQTMRRIEDTAAPDDSGTDAHTALTGYQSEGEYEDVPYRPSKKKKKAKNPLAPPSAPPRSSPEVDEGFAIGPLRNLAMHNNGVRFFKLLSYFDEDPARYAEELDSVNSVGKTALHMAAWRGPAEFVEALLDRGADINRHSTGMGNYGKTAIFYAITRCRDDIVTLLLRRGASVKIVNNKGQSPLSLSASHLKEETIAAIERAEERQRDVDWVNFRATHSDGQSYGDLDPRFLEPPLVSPTGRVRSVNPTSDESRRERYNLPPAQQKKEEGRYPLAIPLTPLLPPTTAGVVVDMEGTISDSNTGSVVSVVRPVSVLSGGVPITPLTFSYPAAVATAASSNIINNNNYTDTTMDTSAVQDSTLHQKSATVASTDAHTAEQLAEKAEEAVVERFGQLRAVPLPCIDASTGLVHLVGVVVTKRHIGKSLVFANIVPPRDHMTAESIADINKYTWLTSAPSANTSTTVTSTSTSSPSAASASTADDVIAPTVAATPASAAATVAVPEGEAMALQLIIGKTMRAELGEEIAAAFCRNLKPGQLVLAVGRLGANGERGEQNLREFRTLDMVVSRLRVLQESYVEVVPRALAALPEEDDTATAYTTAASTAAAATEQSENDGDFAEESPVAIRRGAVKRAQPASDILDMELPRERAAAVNFDDLPVLTLADVMPHIYDTRQQSSTSTSSPGRSLPQSPKRQHSTAAHAVFATTDIAAVDDTSTNVEPSPSPSPSVEGVTLVQDLSGVRQFARSVRALARAASLNAVTMSGDTTFAFAFASASSTADHHHSHHPNSRSHNHNKHPQFHAVVGLDCEWQPSSSSSFGPGSEDYPVSTLQLATREEVFVIDLQSLCGSHSHRHRHRNHDRHNRHDQSQLHGKFEALRSVSGRVIETEAEAALCAALGELFTHRHIAVLGFSVSTDLQKLAASFPHMPCFGRVLNVVDLAPLTRHAFPPTQRSSLLSRDRCRGGGSVRSWKQAQSQEGDMSLTKLSAVALGRRIDKTQQCSTWHLRPLTADQLTYAALDAAVLPRLLDAMLGSSALSSVADIFAKVPRLCMNYKFTFLLHAHSPPTTASSASTSSTSDSEDVFDMVARSDLEADLEERLLRVRVPDGKVRKVLGAVIVQQAWSSASKKEPKTPDVSTIDVSRSSHGHGHRSSSPGDRHNDDRAPSDEQSTAGRGDLTADMMSPTEANDRASLFRPQYRSGRSTSESEVRAGAGAGVDLTIDYRQLSRRVGQFAGKSKYACLQFCLSAAKARGDKTVDSKKMPDGEYLNAEQLSFREQQLASAKAVALRSANDRSGVATLGDALALFINCFDAGGADTAGASARKYANQFLLDGRYFTWFIDAKRWGDGGSSLARGLLATRTDASGFYYWNPDTSEWTDIESRVGGRVFLFARQGTAPFLYCGRCKVLEVEPPASRSNLVKITFELMDYDGDGNSDGNSDHGDHSTATATCVATDEGTRGRESNFKVDEDIKTVTNDIVAAIDTAADADAANAVAEYDEGSAEAIDSDNSDVDTDRDVVDRQPSSVVAGSGGLRASALFLQMVSAHSLEMEVLFGTNTHTTASALASASAGGTITHTRASSPGRDGR